MSLVTNLQFKLKEEFGLSSLCQDTRVGLFILIKNNIIIVNFFPLDSIFEMKC